MFSREDILHLAQNGGHSASPRMVKGVSPIISRSGTPLISRNIHSNLATHAHSHQPTNGAESPLVKAARERIDRVLIGEPAKSALRVPRYLRPKDHACIARECKTSIDKFYPLSMRQLELDARVAVIAHSKGFQRANTLVAKCFCPDEINNYCSQLSERFAGEFNLAGLAGIPFTGVTGMSAFSAHAPDNGNIIIMFGPHVGINDKGQLGKVIRRGQDHESTACGSALAAMNGLLSDPDYSVSMQTDHQQYVVVQALRKHIDRLAKAQEKIMALNDILYEDIEAKLLKIIERHLVSKFTGKVLLVGGILVNTHHGLSDHFVPRTCRLFTREGNEDLLDMLTTKKRFAFPDLMPLKPLPLVCKDTILSEFPHAIVDIQLVLRVIAIMRERGIHRDNTLFADSTCPDEINCLPKMLRDRMGSRFTLGGLTGIPFCGVTGFGAFEHHVPHDGHIFLFFGPHIGMNEDGVLGRVRRHGQCRETTACGSAIHAYEAVRDNHAVDYEEDYQQWYVTEALRTNWSRVSSARMPIKESVEVLYETAERDLMRIVDKTFHGLITFLGGIMINIPGSECDYFLPRTFSIMEDGKITEDLLPALMIP